MHHFRKLFRFIWIFHDSYLEIVSGNYAFYCNPVNILHVEILFYKFNNKLMNKANHYGIYTTKSVF